MGGEPYGEGKLGPRARNPAPNGKKARFKASRGQCFIFGALCRVPAHVRTEIHKHIMKHVVKRPG